MPRLRNEPPISADDLAGALGDALDDLQGWATCGPEGFTRDERRRFDKMVSLRARYLHQQQNA